MSGQQLYDPLGGGTITLTPGAGPIVGDPEATIAISAGGYLTTGDLLYTDTGDASYLNEFTFEGWFQFPAIPGSANIIAEGPLTLSGFRQWVLSLNSTGTISFAVRQTGPSGITVTSEATVSPNAWYHLVGNVHYGDGVTLYINGGGAANAGWTGPVEQLASSAGSEDMRIADPGNTVALDVSDVAFYRTGLAAARVLAHYVAGTQRGYRQTSTGKRVGDVLDTVGSKAPRVTNPGLRSIVPRYMSGQAPLDTVREAVAAEAVDAAFFATADGGLTFLDSGHRSSPPYNSVQAVFGDAGGTELGYLDVTIDYSDAFIVNKWNVTRQGSAESPGATVSSIHPGSVSRYNKREVSLSGLPVVSDTDAQNIATAMLAKYKNPMERVHTLTMTTDDPNVAAAIFRRDLMDKVTVMRTPPGGGARLQQDAWIQKIAISGDSTSPVWKVVWELSPV